MKNISLEQIGVSELNRTELSKIDGGSSLSRAVFWFFGAMFDAPNTLDSAGCNPKIMYS